MAYYSRKDLLEDNCYFHITWRCHGKKFLLASEFAKKTYYDLLVKHKDDYGVQIYSYSLMSNHVHLVGKCHTVNRLSSLMRLVNSRIARKINERIKSCGQVVMDRFKSPMIDTELDLIRVSKYVELNAFRAKIVKHPKNYRWCSYGYYAYGTEDQLITKSPAYNNFGSSVEERRTNYTCMIDEIVEAEGGCVKESYSTVYYIGEPAWVLKKYNKLKSLKKEHENNKTKLKLARDDVLLI